MKAKGWKTVTFNIGSLIVLILGSEHFLAFLPEDAYVYASMLAAVINTMLRFLTTTPVFNGKKLAGGSNMLYIGAVLLFGVFLMGATPTITQTTSYPGRTNIYSYSFSSAIADSDLATLYKDNSSTPFDIRYMLTPNNGDSSISIVLHSTETTPDSTRWTLEHQVSYDGTNWVTWETDVLDSANTSFASFFPHRYGKPYFYRPYLRESIKATNATQTVSIDVIFPEPR